MQDGEFEFDVAPDSDSPNLGKVGHPSDPDLRICIVKRCLLGTPKLWHCKYIIHCMEEICKDQKDLVSISVQEKQRLDAFLSAQLPEVSRAKLQSGIKDGLVTVNGKAQKKVSHQIRWGDRVCCKLPPQVPLDAAPEVRLDLPG